MPFVDVYPPADMPDWPVGSTPQFATRITQSADGTEQASRRWRHPLYAFTIPEVARAQGSYEAVASHWMAMRGPRYSWPFRNPLDFCTCPMVDPNETDPPISAFDQRIGTGDGVTTTFQLYKDYVGEAYMYQRPIKLPIVDSVSIAVGGEEVDPSTYSVSRPGGIVTFDTAPGLGNVIRAGFEFDFEVRFDGDDILEGMRKSWAASGVATLSFVEKRGD